MSVFFKREFLKQNQRIHQRQWHLIDAKDQIVGRLANYLIPILTGKHRPDYVPMLDKGDTVVVINADKVKFSGKKWKQKLYRKHSGYIGGLKERTAEQMFQRDPTRILESAVYGMLPKNSYRKARFSRLKCYAGAEHPHTSQFRGLGAALGSEGSENKEWEPQGEEMKKLWNKWKEHNAKMEAESQRSGREAMQKSSK